MSSTNSHPDHPDQEARRRDLEEEAPRLEFTRRHVVLLLLFVVATLAFLYYVLPQIAGLEDTWQRIERGGDPVWLFVALVLTIASFGGYIVLFNAVFVRPGSPIDLRASYQITMASLAATRVFGAGGVGGIALTAWALRRSGMPRREVADQTLAFLILQYSIYMVSLVVLGLGLRIGDPPGPAPFAVTVVPAIFGAIAILIALALALVPTRSAAAAGHLRRAGRAPRAHRAAPRERAGRVLGRHAVGARPRARATIRRSRARSCSGSATSGRCGPRSTRSATRRRSGSSRWASGSACSATCSRSRAGSAAWTAR